MINAERLKQRRTELGLSQIEVAEQTRARFGVGSQQGYRKLESGEAENSRYLVHYCKILQVDPATIDDELEKGLDLTAEEVDALIQRLPQKDQIELVQKMLSRFQS